MDNIKIIISVLVVILIGVGAFVGFTMYQDNQAAQVKVEMQQKAASDADAAAKAQADAMQARTKCTEAGSYFVVTLDHDNSAVGQDILVKQKADGQACKYMSAEGDFQLQNSDAQYFKAIAGNAMVVDLGTGPTGRSFRLYDLTDKSMVTEKKYFGDLTVASSTLTYQGEAKTQSKTCKGTTVVEKTIDLKSYGVKESKTTKCVAVTQ